ncbi:uncharacterized protein LOC111831086 [Capsella rubella]|uniref:uncharacterized protein LOC111831086 n=1 Tax=Capsella rubella TaxID=81985 RepID=UPI000CD4B89F|nr:uncharacterized protein LOC111831086 [Capsella rubella]
MPQGSSMWKQLLKLRSTAKTFLSCKVGNGLLLDSTVAKARTSDGWIFRGARSNETELLLRHLAEIEINEDVKDTYLWARPHGDPRNQFNFAETWKLVKTHSQEVTWHHQVWFSGSIPKHSFILWLSCLDRLPTLSRLRKWGILEDDTCYLCEIYFETRDHLFLTCPYSYDLWRWGLEKLQIPFAGFNNWDRFLMWLKATSNDPKMAPLKLLLAQAVIYSLWHERNARIYTGIRTPVEALFPILDRRIRNTCLARKDIPKFQGMLNLWFRGLFL